ncbi:MAG: hypothetical protein ACI9KS_000902 [Sulfitobacter sp.]|jgi:hypothetical protein
MTMFSMKPKFDLAEFLAEPVKPGSLRSRGRGMNFQGKPSPASVEEPQADAAAQPAEEQDNPKPE